MLPLSSYGAAANGLSYERSTGGLILDIRMGSSGPSSSSEITFCCCIWALWVNSLLEFIIRPVDSLRKSPVMKAPWVWGPFSFFLLFSGYMLPWFSLFSITAARKWSRSSISYCFRSRDFSSSACDSSGFNWLSTLGCLLCFFAFFSFCFNLVCSRIVSAHFYIWLRTPSNLSLILGGYMFAWFTRWSPPVCKKLFSGPYS